MKRNILYLISVKTNDLSLREQMQCFQISNRKHTQRLFITFISFQHDLEINRFYVSDKTLY